MRSTLTPGTGTPTLGAAARAPDAESGPLEISDCPGAERASWNQALARLPGATWYHRHEWRTINEDGLGHRCEFLLARRAGRVVGLLPLTFLRSRWFGRIVSSMPFVNSGGPCAEDPEVARQLLARAAALAREFRAGFVELRCAQPIDCDWAVSLRKVAMVIRLEDDPERAWASLSSKLRTQVRRTANSGIDVISGGTELLPEFYGVMEQAWRNLGTPLYGYEHFERVLDAFPESTRLYVCRRGGRAVAAALNGYHDGCVEGLWNGCTQDGRAGQANYVLYWEMIRDSVARGYRVFHLGRSTVNSGAIEFKRKWKAEQQPLYWYYWLPRGGRIPALNVDNPKYRLAIGLWRRLPLAVTRRLGPPIARCIP